jgi:hypothetical protein
MLRRWHMSHDLSNHCVNHGLCHGLEVRFLDTAWELEGLVVNLNSRTQPLCGRGVERRHLGRLAQNARPDRHQRRGGHKGL